MGLNKEQQAAVDASAKSILLLAAAGSGKTYTLIERITKLIHDGADPRSILVLTFTNAAAFEMKTRFMNKGFSQIPEFRTFHAFCYKLLRDDPRICTKLGFSKCPDIATEENHHSGLELYFMPRFFVYNPCRRLQDGEDVFFSVPWWYHLYIL